MSARHAPSTAHGPSDTIGCLGHGDSISLKVPRQSAGGNLYSNTWDKKLSLTLSPHEPRSPHPPRCDRPLRGSLGDWASFRNTAQLSVLAQT